MTKTIKLLMLAAVLMVSSHAIASPRCTVVYDSDPGVLEHEIAHCNGWTHPAGDPNSTTHHHPRPPVQYRKPYPNLVILKAKPMSVFQTRSEASVLCEKLDGQTYDTPYLKTIRGCAIGGKQKD